MSTRPPPRATRFARKGGIAIAVLALFTGCASEAERAAEQRLALGHKVFSELSQPTCATCHTLKHAGASGKVGPNLDQLRPDTQRIAAAVTNGVGIMPAQGGKLDEEQIRALAFYVSRVAGKAE